MGIYGMGNAFNLRYQPRQFIGFGRRPMPQPMMMPTSSYSNTTNITYKSGMNNFWSFMSGLTQGIFESGIFEKLNQKQAEVTAQGTQQKEEKSPLDTLKGLFPKYTIDVCPTDKNKLTVMKDGKFIVEGTLEEVYDKLKNMNTDKPDNKEEPPKEEPPKEEPPKEEPPKEEGQTTPTTPTTPTKPTKPTSPVQSSTRTNRSSATSLKGTVLHVTQNGDTMTKEKVNGKYVFHYYKKENGSYKEISEQEFRTAHNTGNKQVNITALKEGSYTTRAMQQGHRIKGQGGRYAEKSKDGWKFYSHDGQLLTYNHVKKVDPKLYAATVGKDFTASVNAARAKMGDLLERPD